jgi:dTDP-glucose 4,6-dehydratase/UDP-glucose 4-epimerase
VNIIVLGSEGFIGSHCIQYFLNKKYRVYGVDLLATPQKNGYEYFVLSGGFNKLIELIKSNTIHILINAAGSGNVAISMKDPLLDFKLNCLDTINILELIRKHNPKIKYLHISSAAVYGNPLSLPIYEEAPLKPISPYGFHKSISETICLEYTQTYHISTAIIRPFSVFGPGLKKQIFWEIYRKYKDNLGNIELFGSGEESRDFIYINDLISAIDLIISKGSMRGEVYNVGTGVETKIKEAIKVYVNELDKNRTFAFNGLIKEGDPKNWKADINKLRQLGFEPKTSIEEGLRLLAEWLKMNY